MNKKEILQLVSVAILSIIITTVILCMLPLIGSTFVPVIVIAFLAFVWWASNHE
jgi:hypothetical protein